MKTLLFSLLFFTVAAKAQLADFTLQVTVAEETCLGNGSLTLASTNLTPLSTLLYKVYKMPNTTNPISILTTGNFIGSLTSGTYRVIAIQALGSLINSKQQDVVIHSNITQFNFAVSSSNLNCATGGNITINTTSGIGSRYEILSGPVTRLLQASNVFTDLPSGTYNIRAFDICGIGKVKTFTLSLVNNSLDISDPAYSDTATPVCDSISVSNMITPSSGNIGYPLTVKHSLTPMSMNGSSMVIEQTFTTGSPDSLVVSAVVPRYLTESYSYELRVTDNCNTVYEKLDNIVNPAIDVILTPGIAPCGKKFLIVTSTKLTAPYSINFINPPAGFDASDYNTTPNGPFTDGIVIYGSEDNPLPFGNYEVEISDACGRTATASLLLEYVPLIPVAKGTNNGCFSEFGKIRISVPPQKLASVIMTDAPDAYRALQTLPQDFTASINAAGLLTISNVPLGTYKFILTDDCGETYLVTVVVPPYVEKPFNIATLPDCGAGLGTVRYRSGNGDLTFASIIGAPAAYAANHALPYNVTGLINSAGDLYMNNLPSGTYKFKGIDMCGVVNDTLTINVEGYIPPQNSFTFTPNCGTFSVKVTDAGNGLEGASFWLQKFDDATSQWGHPANGTYYTEGTDPTAASGIKLSNNIVRNNLGYSGKFRIVKRFETFSSGSSVNNVCISILGEFNYADGLAISNAYSLSCIGSPNDVYIETMGYPTSYKIIKKNGVTVNIDNGTNNVFSNLEIGDYMFAVEDACGNVVAKPFSVQMLPSITDAAHPKDMIFCAGDADVANNQFHLTDQNAGVLGQLYSALYTITYHISQQDADTGQNSLPEYYTNTVNGQTIYARLVHNEIALCHGTTSFQLFIGTAPKPTITTTGLICDGNRVQLTASAGFNAYTWSTGETTRTIYVNEPGNYTVIVEKEQGDQFCDGFAEVVVKESFTPEILKVETTDWSQSDNSITVHAAGTGSYQYSIDGIHYQDDNTFSHLECGAYTVYVKDAEGCGIAQKEVVLLYYPNYFSPNGDGVHDKWQIKYSILEPHLRVAIYDRYGKLITTFGSTHDGWDGSLNGQNLPSTDYWFVVTREDGREYRGHFAMVR